MARVRERVLAKSFKRGSDPQIGADERRWGREGFPNLGKR